MQPRRWLPVGPRMSKKDKGRLPQFVPLLHATLDCPAWRATSHGARSLYVALKRRVPRERNVAWVSYKDAIAELKSSKRKIADWFRELQHYGLIVLHSQGCLGTDGKGQSPHWRLTELGKNSPRKQRRPTRATYPRLSQVGWGDVFSSS